MFPACPPRVVVPGSSGPRGSSSTSISTHSASSSTSMEEDGVFVAVRGRLLGDGRSREGVAEFSEDEVGVGPVVSQGLVVDGLPSLVGVAAGEVVPVRVPWALSKRDSSLL